MDKIRTVLPYPEEVEDSIRKYGAIVDMSKPEFPDNYKENEIRYSAIYLRNTGYENIDLDFSSLSLETRKNYLLFYMNSDIVFDCKELSSSWLGILLKYAGVEISGIPNILNESETESFIEENKFLLESMLQFVQSLPLYLISRMNLAKPITMDFPINKDTLPFNNNILYVIRNEHINLAYIADKQFEPLFFEKYFTDDNTELFESLIYLDFYQTLDSLAEMKSEDCTMLINTVLSFEEENERLRNQCRD